MKLVNTSIGKQAGVMLIEVLIGLILLSMSFIAYSKAVAQAANTSLHMDDELRATDLTNLVINSIELYAMSLPDSTSQTQLESLITQFSSGLMNNLNNGARDLGYQCQLSAPASGASQGVYQPTKLISSTPSTQTLGDIATYQNLKTPQCITIAVDREYAASGNPNVYIHVNSSRVSRAVEGLELVNVENRHLVLTRKSKTAVKAWY